MIDHPRLAAPLVLLCLACTWSDARAEGAPDSDAWQRSYDAEVTGAYRDALDALQGLPEPGLESYMVQLRKGWLTHLCGDHRESIEAYRRAIAAEPEAIEPRMGILLPQMTLYLWLDAEQSAREGLELDPHNYTLLSRHAWILYNLGRYPEAEQAYRDVLRRYPSDVEMRAGLGWTLLKRQSLDEASATFQQVLQVAPKSASAQSGLAACQSP